MDDVCQLGIIVGGDARGHGAVAPGQEELTFKENECAGVLNQRSIGERWIANTRRNGEQSTPDETEEALRAHGLIS
jgi:hypothetical protein